MSKPACVRCKYWSELIAKSENLKIMAMCLNPEGPYHSQYTWETTACEKFEEGPPVDTP